MASPPGSRPVASSNWKTCSLIQAGDGAGLPPRLVNRIAQVLRARVQRLEVTANLHALGFYRAAGFIDCGVAGTVFSAAPRMVLDIPDGSYTIRHGDVSAEPPRNQTISFSEPSQKVARARRRVGDRPLSSPRWTGREA